MNQIDNQVVWADRDGIGNYSRAFNEAFLKFDLQSHGGGGMDYVWMISNINFKENIPKILERAMDDSGFEAIHPAMAGSDHQFQWPNNTAQILETPYIEWTAPIVRYDVFKKNLLDDRLPYAYMDLDWCYRIRQQGGKVGVAHAAVIDHVYLRFTQRLHYLSKVRANLRDYYRNFSQQVMIEKYGDDWRKVMQYTGRG